MDFSELLDLELKLEYLLGTDQVSENISQPARYVGYLL